MMAGKKQVYKRLRVPTATITILRQTNSHGML